MQPVLPPCLFFGQRGDMTADRAQLQRCPGRPHPGHERHPAAVLGERNGVGGIALGAPQRLGELVDRSGVEHRHRDAIGPVQRHRHIQRIDPGRLQRHPHRGAALQQPCDQLLMPGGGVGELALLEIVATLGLNGNRQGGRADVDAAVQHGTG